MPGWKCFMLIPSAYMRRSFRKYTIPFEGLAPCPERGGIHEAKLVIEPRIHLPDGIPGDEPVEPWLPDPRWPERCACGHYFGPKTTWQVLLDRLYQGAPDEKLHGLDDPDLAPGAMWDAPWISEACPSWSGPDGRSLVVRLPSGTAFPMDVPAKDAGKWARTGTPPLVTLHPSINEVGSYHGTLTAGLLSECQEGRLPASVPRTA